MAQLELKIRHMISATTNSMLATATPLFALILPVKVPQSPHERSIEKCMEYGEWQIQQKSSLPLNQSLLSLSSYFLSSQLCRHSRWMYLSEPVQRQMLMSSLLLSSDSSRQTLHSFLQLRSSPSNRLFKVFQPGQRGEGVWTATMSSWLVISGRGGCDMGGSRQKIVQTLQYIDGITHLINYQIKPVEYSHNGKCQQIGLRATMQAKVSMGFLNDCTWEENRKKSIILMQDHLQKKGGTWTEDIKIYLCIRLEGE